MRTLDVWYARVDVERQFTGWAENADAERRLDLDRAIVRARRKDSLRALAKLTHDAGGEPRIISDPPLVVPIDELVAEGDAPRIRARLVSYLGSYAETLTPDRRLLLAPFAGPSRLPNQGRRVVEGQRLMQAAGDVLLGWLRIALDLDGQARDYLGSGDVFDGALAEFAETYADQNARDYAALQAAVRDGTLAADLNC
jgi:hypothetical protein